MIDLCMAGRLGSLKPIYLSVTWTISVFLDSGNDDIEPPYCPDLALREVSLSLAIT